MYKRQLKYNSPEMDLDSLQRELAGQNPESSWDDDEADTEYGDYSDWNDEYGQDKRAAR